LEKTFAIVKKKIDGGVVQIPKKSSMSLGDKLAETNGRRGGGASLGIRFLNKNGRRGEETPSINRAHA